MESADSSLEGEGTAVPTDDLRAQVSSVLLQRLDVVAVDAVGLFPYSAGTSLDLEYCTRLGQAFGRSLACAIRDGRVDPRGAQVADVRALALERALEPQQLFTFAYLTERTSLDELALHTTLGAMSEQWPVVAQLVRRASFEYLAALVARGRIDRTETTITDGLTTLQTRQVFDTVLLKETERSSRLGYSLALILFDVDRLSSLNELHGYGVGNQILERLGVLVRRYFRQHDWVARYGDDEIAVLLTGSDADHASELADRAKTTVEERLAFTDHRTGNIVSVTISGAVVNVPGSTTSVVDPERLLIEAEQALARAKKSGRNRIEAVSAAAASRALPRSSPSV